MKERTELDGKTKKREDKGKEKKGREKEDLWGQAAKTQGNSFVKEGVEMQTSLSALSKGCPGNLENTLCTWALLAT